MSTTVYVNGNHVGFHCPGCDDYHQIRTGENGWTWDGSIDAPTFSPSVLVQGPIGEVADGRCHSFVRAGRIEFLTDSTLPEWKGF